MLLPSTVQVERAALWRKIPPEARKRKPRLGKREENVSVQRHCRMVHVLQNFKKLNRFLHYLSLSLSLSLRTSLSVSLSLSISLRHIHISSAFLHLRPAAVPSLNCCISRYSPLSARPRLLPSLTLLRLCLHRRRRRRRCSRRWLETYLFFQFWTNTSRWRSHSWPEVSLRRLKRRNPNQRWSWTTSRQRRHKRQPHRKRQKSWGRWRTSFSTSTARCSIPSEFTVKSSTKFWNGTTRSCLGNSAYRRSACGGRRRWPRSSAFTVCRTARKNSVKNCSGWRWRRSARRSWWRAQKGSSVTSLVTM